VATTRADRRSRLSSGLEALGVPSGGGPLYELALTHRSFAFESGAPNHHNERLEFLGDSILGAVVTDLIYRSYPDLSEGEMTVLRASVVNEVPLADLARSIGLGDHIRLGKGEEASGGRDKSSLLSDGFEALVGAVYLDRGLDVIAAATLFRPLIEAAAQSGTRFDSKTALQEVVVRERGELPSYRVASSGPDHERRFTAHVYAGPDLCGSGSGRSKKEAEQEAAREALQRLEGGRGARAS
jgi:ribonuclease III